MVPARRELEGRSEPDRVLPDPPRLLVASKEPDGRLWAEVLNLGGYDVLTLPFVQQELHWAVECAWENWERDTRRAHARWREPKTFEASVRQVRIGYFYQNVTAS